MELIYHNLKDFIAGTGIGTIFYEQYEEEKSAIVTFASLFYKFFQIVW